MAEIINMPRLSDTMEEGTLAKWFKKVGDSVKEGEILAEIETDKATMEFESFHDGVLLHIGIDEGSTAPVDSIIAVIGSKGEDISSIIKGVNAVEEEPKPVVEEEPKLVVEEEPKPVVEEEPKPVLEEEPKPVLEEEPKPDIKQASLSNESTDRILISPLARKLATEKGIDIKLVKGSGDNGRIIKRDIDSYKPTNYSQFIQPRPSITESIRFCNNVSSKTFILILDYLRCQR